MPKPGPRTTYKYSDEFKSTAVRLSGLAGDDDVSIARGELTRAGYPLAP